MKVEHSGNSVYAVLTDDGPAIYPTLDELAEAIRSGAVEVHDGDREYYEAREWLPVADRDLAEAGIADEA